MGNVRADIVARKDDELIVVEFKLGEWSEGKSREIIRMRNEVVHKLGGKFNIALISLPKRYRY